MLNAATRVPLTPIYGANMGSDAPRSTFQPTRVAADGEWRDNEEPPEPSPRSTIGQRATSPKHGSSATPTDGSLVTLLRGLLRRKRTTPTSSEGQDYVNTRGTWTGAAESIEMAQLLDLRIKMEDIHDRRDNRIARREARRLMGSQQKWIFLGVLALLVLIVGFLVFGQTNKMSEAFALELMRSTVPVLIGAIAGVLGVLFGSGGRGDGTKP